MSPLSHASNQLAWARPLTAEPEQQWERKALSLIDWKVIEDEDATIFIYFFELG
jgi:hypothetical protein